MGVGDTVFALLRGCGLVGLVSCRPVVDVAFSSLAGLFSKMFAVLSFPLTMSNMLQRYLAKPWLPFCKTNKGTDISKVKARRNSENAGMILYVFFSRCVFSMPYAITS